jgi:hypothetical protein
VIPGSRLLSGLLFGINTTPAGNAGPQESGVTVWCMTGRCLPMFGTGCGSQATTLQ